MRFAEWKMYVNWNVTEVYSYSLNLISTGTDDGLANMGQTFTWINDDIVPRRIFASLGRCKLQNYRKDSELAA